MIFTSALPPIFDLLATLNNDNSATWHLPDQNPSSTLLSSSQWCDHLECNRNHLVTGYQISDLTQSIRAKPSGFHVRDPYLESIEIQCKNPLYAAVFINSCRRRCCRSEMKKYIAIMVPQCLIWDQKILKKVTSKAFKDCVWKKWDTGMG